MRWMLPLAFLLMSFAGCVDEAPPADDPAEPAPSNPVTPDVTPEEITAMEYTATAHEGATDGIWLHDDKAYLSGPGSGLRIIDISDPTQPIVLANETADVGNSRDVDIMVHPNGRTYATLSSGGVDIVDVTNSTAPVLISTAPVSSHNHGVVPNTTIVYNSISINTDLGIQRGETGKIDIIDFADPAVPVIKEFFFPAAIIDSTGAPRQVSSTTCHDMTFNEELQLAYCAGVSDTTIWDIADPWNPEIIMVIDWPGVNIHHGVWDARGGDVLILGDELAGAAAGPACNSAVPYPTSALWFFDMTQPEPTPMGYFNVEWDSVSTEDQNFNLCTTHFGQVLHDHDMLVMGWYAAGTVLVDFSELSTTNPAGIEQVDIYRPGGDVNTWEARHYKGYVYTGDTERGMEILRLV